MMCFNHSPHYRYEPRKICFRSSYGNVPILSLRPMCRALPRRTFCEKFFLPGTISCHGVRSIIMSRIIARHRSLFVSAKIKTLSSWFFFFCRPINPRGSERKKRLEYLLGFHTITHYRSASSVYRRSVVYSRTFQCLLRR